MNGTERTVQKWMLTNKQLIVDKAVKAIWRKNSLFNKRCYNNYSTNDAINNNILHECSHVRIKTKNKTKQKYLIHTSQHVQEINST